ncbi:hypothetical protein BGE01nite_46690 [Brevifollis gellanilyticus]|uniref:Glycosyltransferase RgtA/B/C/D-like domain-containing protein n=2 Tax=Brevifollis gellanilyticus TaxID=748831 RepID=A0A512MF78_9BACT|nr:hypothetical protein BGE01nite_46690 [Brevifollis gellanilyticus]
MIVARVAGPSAMHRFDQPKTVAYTASMVLHHEWLLPDDMFGRPSTKPPLVNWLAAPLVAMGFWTEWAVKMPMLLGSLLTLGIIIKMGRHLLSQCAETALHATEGGLLAGMAWLTTPGSMDLIYHCRPDPLLVTCLAAAWMFATWSMEAGARGWMKAGLWIATGLAGLAKGPPALLPMLFVPLAAWLIPEKKGLASSTGWRWGIPLALGIIGLWLVPVAVLHTDHLFKVLLGRELLSRVAGVGQQFGSATKSGGAMGLLLGLYKNPVWLVEKMLPWSLATLAALWVIGPRRWLRHPLAPAILWLVLVLAFFSLTAGKTADYIAPAFPAAAILAAYACVRTFGRWKLGPVFYGWAGLLMAAALCVQSFCFSSAATKPNGDHLKEFAAQVTAKTADDSIAFVATGYNTLQFFLRRHQPGDPTPEELKSARWIIMPPLDGLTPEIVSEKLPSVFSSKSGTLGLYRADEKVREQALKMLQTNKIPPHNDDGSPE